jgi:putative membrane protein
MGGFWIFPFFGLVIMAIFLVLLFRGFGGRGRGGGPFCGPPSWRDGQDTPAEIARRRYARGEITREELEEMLETLKR